MSDLREALAALAHEQWIGWMLYLFEQCPEFLSGEMAIRSSTIQRWLRQMHTAYADLSEAEKESDREEADRVLALLAAHKKKR